jgi:hypothetical protein
MLSRRQLQASQESGVVSWNPGVRREGELPATGSLLLVDPQEDAGWLALGRHPSFHHDAQQYRGMGLRRRLTANTTHQGDGQQHGCHRRDT